MICCPVCRKEVGFFHHSQAVWECECERLRVRNDTQGYVTIFFFTIAPVGHLRPNIGVIGEDLYILSRNSKKVPPHERERLVEECIRIALAESVMER